MVLAAAANVLRSEWATAKDGSLRELEQKVEVGSGTDRRETHAKFEASKNETTIRTKQSGSETRGTRPGLLLLRPATARGALRIEP